MCFNLYVLLGALYIVAIDIHFILRCKLITPIVREIIHTVYFLFKR